MKSAKLAFTAMSLTAILAVPALGNLEFNDTTTPLVSVTFPHQGIEREWAVTYGGTGHWLPGPFTPLTASVHPGSLPGVYAEAQSTFSMTISPDNVVDIGTTNQAAAPGPNYTQGWTYARLPGPIVLRLSGITTPTMIFYSIEYEARGEIAGSGDAELCVIGPGLGSPAPIYVNSRYNGDFQEIGSRSGSGISNDGVLAFGLHALANVPASSSSVASIVAHFRITISDSPAIATESTTWGQIKGLYR